MVAHDELYKIRRATMNINQFNQYRTNYQPPREDKYEILKSIALAIAIGSTLGYLLATNL